MKKFDNDMPPSLDMPKEKKVVQRPINPAFKDKLICKVIGHKVNDGVFIDSHDNFDALSFCERCGELDV